MEPASPTEAPLTRPRLTRQASFKDTCRFNISYGTPHWGWNELRRPSLFRNAYTEFIGTWAFCFLHIGLVLALVKQSVTPSGETLYSTSVAVALATFVSFTLLVYSMALPSGGHFNPMFSMSPSLHWIDFYLQRPRLRCGPNPRWYHGSNLRLGFAR